MIFLLSLNEIVLQACLMVSRIEIPIMFGCARNVSKTSWIKSCACLVAIVLCLFSGYSLCIHPGGNWTLHGRVKLLTEVPNGSLWRREISNSWNQMIDGLVLCGRIFWARVERERKQRWSHRPTNVFRPGAFDIFLHCFSQITNVSIRWIVIQAFVVLRIEHI